MQHNERILIACEMLRDEVSLVMQRQKLQKTLPVVWIDRGLHDVPSRLRIKLQDVINGLSDHKTIMLAFCQCGHGTAGLESKTATLVIPRFVDCIHMLRSLAPTQPPDIDIHSLYYTSGWVEGSHFLTPQIMGWQKRYGLEKAQFIIDETYQHYTGLQLIDTGAYILADYSPQARCAAAQLGLTYGECTGTTRVLDDLLAGRWTDEFCVAQPGRPLVFDDF